jgi:hypothetical protein
MIRRILAVSALGTVGVLGLTALPANAGNIGPNVNLKMKNDVLKFKPKELNLVLSKGAKCKVTNYAFSITNKTTTTQQIDINGQPGPSLAPGGETLECVGVGTSTFTVPGTGATLTVNMAPAS